MSDQHDGLEPRSVGEAQRPEVDMRRRALVRVGWVVPVILAMGIPRHAFAQQYGNPTGGGGAT
jgi:hypothetical protein